MADNSVIGYLLAALIGIIPGCYAIYAQRREKKAAAANLEAEARKLADEITERVLRRARDEMAELTEENVALKKRLADFEERHNREIGELTSMVECLRNGVEQLCNQIRELGHEPVFNLEPEDEQANS